MKKNGSSKWLYFSMYGLLVITNIVVLTGVAINRSGAPDSRLILSERELVTPYSYNHDSDALSFRIDWKVLPKGKNDDPYFTRYSRMPAWFDEAKLKEIGFDIRSSDLHKISVPKEAFIVLELNGEAYRTYIRNMEDALQKAGEKTENDPENKEASENYNYQVKYFKEAKETGSRLFAVDAGRDPEMLRKKYPDRGKYMIAGAVIEKHTSYNENKKEKYIGYIRKLNIEIIHIPLEYRTLLKESGHKRMTGEDIPFNYEIELAYGKRYEPYILSVK